MVDAKLAMAFSDDEVDQLKGLIPRPQGFHRRCIVLQDSMNSLFSGSTVEDKGSLFHIKNKFGFRTVKKKTSDCINSAVDFFNFATEASVCLIVCDILHMDNIDDICQTIPSDTVAVQNLFVSICEQVFNLVWPHINRQSIQQAITGGDNQPGAENPLDHESTNSDTEDPRFGDDTILYWNDDSSLDETLPYYDESEDDCFGNKHEYLDFISRITIC
jgi:hypothetical protein